MAGGDVLLTHTVGFSGGELCLTNTKSHSHKDMADGDEFKTVFLLLACSVYSDVFPQPL